MSVHSTQSVSSRAAQTARDPTYSDDVTRTSDRELRSKTPAILGPYAAVREHMRAFVRSLPPLGMTNQERTMKFLTNWLRESEAVSIKPCSRGVSSRAAQTARDLSFSGDVTRMSERERCTTTSAIAGFDAAVREHMRAFVRSLAPLGMTRLGVRAP
jgi:hypothetical protein